MYVIRNVNKDGLLYRDVIKRMLALATTINSCADGKAKFFYPTRYCSKNKFISFSSIDPRDCCWCSHHIISAHARLNVYVRAPFHTVTQGEARTR